MISARGDKEHPNIILKNLILRNDHLRTILGRSWQLRLPNWYLGAGSIAQTVWNLLHDYSPEKNIKDIDIAYYDPDLSYEGEDKHIRAVRTLLDDIPIELDVKNQARVHLWFKDRFGYEIEPLRSVEEAITTWPTTSTCVGVRIRNGKFLVYAPYGLDDLFNMIVRPNKKQITEEIYLNKVNRWKECWPQLTIIDWNQE